MLRFFRVLKNPPDQSPVCHTPDVPSSDTQEQPKLSTGQNHFPRPLHYMMLMRTVKTLEERSERGGLGVTISDLFKRNPIGDRQSSQKIQSLLNNLVSMGYLDYRDTEDFVRGRVRTFFVNPSNPCSYRGVVENLHEEEESNGL